MKEVFNTRVGMSSAPSITNQDRRVLGLIGDQIKPLTNRFDSDKMVDESIDKSFIS